MALTKGSRLLSGVDEPTEQQFVRIVQHYTAAVHQPPHSRPSTALQNMGIDVSFVVSINQKRANRATNHLRKADIDNVVVWPGVVGKRLFEQRNPTAALEGLLSPVTRQELRSTTHANYFVPHNAGAVGCYFSHAALWYFIVQNGLTAALIFEDDIACKADRRDYVATIEHCIRAAGGVGAFDVLHLSAHSTWGHGGAEQIEPFGNGLVRSRGPGYSNMAYLITQRGARALLQRLLPISITIDAYVFERAREDDSFLLLRPEKRLFDHPLTNFASSSIGYRPSLHIIAPQYRSLAVGIVVAVLLGIIAVLVARLHHFAQVAAIERREHDVPNAAQARERLPKAPSLLSVPVAQQKTSE